MLTIAHITGNLSRPNTVALTIIIVIGRTLNRVFRVEYSSLAVVSISSPALTKLAELTAKLLLWLVPHISHTAATYQLIEVHLI